MKDHKVVSPEEWLSARISLLEKEKAFTRRRDDLSRQRRELPWEACESLLPGFLAQQALQESGRGFRRVRLIDEVADGG
jgi:hypothetical protein